MQERFSPCRAAVPSLNISSAFAGVDNFKKHPAAKRLTRKPEPKRNITAHTTARGGIQNLFVTEAFKCFAIAGSASLGWITNNDALQFICHGNSVRPRLISGGEWIMNWYFHLSGIPAAFLIRSFFTRRSQQQVPLVETAGNFLYVG